MSTNLKPYPMMRDSGVEWLGEVPEHWEVRRLKHVSRFFYGDSLPNDVREAGDIPVYGSNGKVGSNIIPNTHSPCIVVGRKGSFGKVNYCDEPVFAIDTTYYVDDRTTQENICWLFYALRWLRLDEVSKDSAVPGLDRGDAYERIVPKPSISEQASIVKYLDYMDRRVRRLIRANRKLIALLTEQKQAIIHRVVTRGLDPNVPLKDSGIDWLGKIPEHWEVARLRNVTKFVTSGSRGWSSYAADEGPLFIRVANLSRMSLDLRFDDVVRLNLPDTSEAARTRVQTGDLLLSITAYIGSVAVVPETLEEAYVSQHVARCALRNASHNPRWLGYVLLSEVGQTHGKLSLYGGTKDGLSLDDVKNYPILLPPRSEQYRLVSEIEGATVEIDSAITHTTREIDLLNEYRTRLIADVVTGKLDVREAAAALPEVDPLAADDEINNTLDSESEADLDDLYTIPEEDAA